MLLVAVIAACSDRSAPTAPLQRVGFEANATASCTNLTELTQLVNDVFGTGSPDANSALSKLRSADRALKKGDTTSAQSAAKNLIRFVLDKASTLPGEQYVQQLIGSLECYVGLRDDTFLVFPEDLPQVILTDDGQAGIRLPANPVSEPTLVTLTILPNTTVGLLDTKLDQYPIFLEVTQTSNVVNSLIQPVVVAVCAPSNIPLAVAQRLRLGHQASAGFEVTPEGDASFLNCAPPTTADASGAMRGWMGSVANFVLPQLLHAQGEEAFGGGVGGTVTEFSPFGPVDPMLEFGGGVGGTVTEFIRVPSPAGTSPMRTPKIKGSERGTETRGAIRGSMSMLALGSSSAIIDCTDGAVGTAVSTACRPQVTVATANGTVLTGVPVTFSIQSGGGTTSIDDTSSRTCGTFGASASTVTNVNGKAGACWILGAEGENTLLATVTAGGDAPEGVYFTPTSNLFTRIAAKNIATLSLSGLEQAFTGAGISASVTTEPAGLETVSVTYDGLMVPPVNVGTYAVVATLVNATFDGTASGTLTITPATQAALVLNGPATLLFGGSVQLTATGGSGDGLVTYSAGASTGCVVSATGLLQITSGEGSCSITATKAASTNFTAVTSQALTISPAKATATLSLNGGTFTYDGLAKSATVTTTPVGLDVVSVTYDGSATLPVGAGTYAVVASLTNADYAASNATGTLTIEQAAQVQLTIVGAAPVVFGGDAVTLGTSGGSGTGAVTFDATGSTACEVTGNLVAATSGSGTCVVTATKAGDANHLPTTSASVSLSLSRAAATLTLGGLSTTYDGSAKSATVTTAPVAGLATLAVTYDNSAVLPIEAGTYAVVATLENPNYVAAPATGDLVIAPARQAPFTLTAPATAIFGSTVQLAVTGGSGDGAVTYTSETPIACAMNVTTPGAVDILSGVGTCTVSAMKAGSRNYEPTTPTSASIALGKAGQAISFASLSGRTYGDAAFTVSASASSGLPVSFSAVAGSSCTVTGSTVTLSGAGNCAVQASQAGSDDFVAATPVTRSFGIAKRIATATAGSGTITLGNTASLPCAVTGLLAADAGTVTCTTAVPSITTGGTYTTTPVISPANPTNYAVTTVTGTLNVTYVKQNCFAAPIRSLNEPPTTSGITKGATVQIKCTLLDANGRVVSNATGDLRIVDFYSGVEVQSSTNAFRFSSGSYANKLSTSGPNFVKGNFYRVIATWNDRTTTEGWFYLNK